MWIWLARSLWILGIILLTLRTELNVETDRFIGAMVILTFSLVFCYGEHLSEKLSNKDQ